MRFLPTEGDLQELAVALGSVSAEFHRRALPLRREAALWETGARRLDEQAGELRSAWRSPVAARFAERCRQLATSMRRAAEVNAAAVDALERLSLRTDTAASEIRRLAWLRDDSVTIQPFPLSRVSEGDRFSPQASVPVPIARAQQVMAQWESDCDRVNHELAVHASSLARLPELEITNPILILRPPLWWIILWWKFIWGGGLWRPWPFQPGLPWWLRRRRLRPWVPPMIYLRPPSRQESPIRYLPLVPGTGEIVKLLPVYRRRLVIVRSPEIKQLLPVDGVVFGTLPLRGELNRGVLQEVVTYSVR